MRKKTYQERVDDYLKAEYGRTFSISDTNQYCSEFKALPLLSSFIPTPSKIQSKIGFIKSLSLIIHIN